MLTHLLLCRSISESFQMHEIGEMFKKGEPYFLVGSLGPDLPYASIADINIFRNDSPLADRFHHEKTADIYTAGLKQLKNSRTLSRKDLCALFCFLTGYLSHLIADAVIHPFIRDKVGDYPEHQAEHRALEMKLDIFYLSIICSRQKLNPEKYFTETEGIYNKFSLLPESVLVLNLFSYLIKKIYSEDHFPREIIEWISSSERLLHMATGDHLGVFKEIALIKTYFYPDISDILNQYPDICNLFTPADRSSNFLNKYKIDYFGECIPCFFRVIKPLIKKSYDHVFDGGPSLTNTDLPSADLDTGRIPGSDLNVIPVFWDIPVLL